jgi:hypothetical protein
MTNVILLLLASFGVSFAIFYFAVAYLSRNSYKENVFQELKFSVAEEKVSGLWEKMDQIKERLIYRKADTPTETTYFLLLFLLYIHSGLSVRAALGKAYYSISSMGFNIGKYITEIISKVDSGIPFFQATKVLDRFPEMAAMKEAFSSIFQSYDLGSAIEDSVRTTITDMEKTRIIKAEERMSKMTVLIAIPLVFGFLPSIIVMVAYPAFHQVLKILTEVAK